MYKVFIVLGVIAILFLAIQLNEYSHGRLDFCLKDQITCATEKMQAIRDNRDKVTQERNTFVTEYNKGTVDWNTQEDAKVEAIKATLPAGYVSELIQKGIYKDVPKTILEKLIPEAKADSEKLPPIVDADISLNTEEAKSTSPNRYSAVLAKYNAPYKDVNIERYCNEAGMAQRDCDIMVAIAQQESQMGKDFHCIQQTKAYAITLGQTYYHNPMGLTDASVHYKNYAATGKKNSDFQGCFIRKFDSWDAFWKFMPQSFMDKDKPYYVGNWSTIKQLSGIWVNGNVSSPSQSWIDTVSGVLNSGTLTTR